MRYCPSFITFAYNSACQARQGTIGLYSIYSLFRWESALLIVAFFPLSPGATLTEFTQEGLPCHLFHGLPCPVVNPSVTLEASGETPPGAPAPCQVTSLTCLIKPLIPTEVCCRLPTDVVYVIRLKLCF